MRDIEELRSRVVFTDSRSYVDEVIAAYSASAYRSAILALWVAVTADLIEKIRILSDQGEAAAAAVKKRLDGAIKAGAQALMTFERELLVVARDELQLIDQREYEELDRLHRDRHFCAHPAYVREERLFSPGPELVRVHLVNAVDGLLGHGPVTGRKAVERFQREVGEMSFPRDDAKLEEYLRSGYIDRSTPALRRNLIKVVCKASLMAELDSAIRWRYTRTALILQRISPAEFAQELRPILVAQQNSLDEDGLWRLIDGLCYIPGTWELLNGAARNRIEQLLERAPIGDLTEVHELFGPLPLPPLDKQVQDRLVEAVDAVARGEATIRIAEPDRKLLPLLEDLLREAGNYYRADGVLRWINSIADILMFEDLDRLIEIGVSNSQVFGSVLAARQLQNLRSATSGRFMPAQWDAWEKRLSDARKRPEDQIEEL